MHRKGQLFDSLLKIFYIFIKIEYMVYLSVFQFCLSVQTIAIFEASFNQHVFANKPMVAYGELKWRTWKSWNLGKVREEVTERGGNEPTFFTCKQLHCTFNSWIS